MWCPREVTHLQCKLGSSDVITKVYCLKLAIVLFIFVSLDERLTRVMQGVCSDDVMSMHFDELVLASRLCSIVESCMILSYTCTVRQINHARGVICRKQ